MPLKFILVAAAFVSFSSVASATEEALTQTQNLMRDQQAMEAYAKANPDAAKALTQMKQLTNNDPQKKAEFMNLSSDVFTDIANANKDANGETDVTAVQSQLQNAFKDPAAFLNKLSPEQQQRVRALASEIEKQNAAAQVKPPAEQLK